MGTVKIDQLPRIPALSSILQKSSPARANRLVRAREKHLVVSSEIHRWLRAVAFNGDVALQDLVDGIMVYVIKHKEILDHVAN